MSVKYISSALFAFMGCTIATNVMATNGMNMEGYGPEATAMGGASYAYDNGTAAVMNNPATLGLMSSNHRFDFALGALGPDISAEVSTPGGPLNANSNATAFYMPAIGWVKRKNNITFGIGVFAQGGMGTEYDANSWMADPSQGNNSALSQGLVNRSEVGVGRAILPLTMNVNDKLTVGGSFDFVWAGMDLQMAMSEAQFQNLANPSAQTMGHASGSLVNAFGSMYAPFGGTGINALHHAYFDFSNDNDFTGEASAIGFAGKLGITMKLTSKLSLGASYHSKTRLNDLTTDNATMRMAVNGDLNLLTGGQLTGTGDIDIPVSGKITVNDFQWPSTIGIGMAFQATDKLFVAADIKRIGWADVMEEFNMTFEADNDPAKNGNFAGLKMDMALLQKWSDQTVLALGGAYKVTDAFTVRAGYNHASNPVPNSYLNALFPAIIESHVTAGFGYAFGASSSVDLSLTKAMEIEASNPGDGANIPKVTSTHSQFSWQLMYSYRY